MIGTIKHCISGLSSLLYYHAYDDYVTGEVFEPRRFKLAQKPPQHSDRVSVFKLFEPFNEFLSPLGSFFYSSFFPASFSLKALRILFSMRFMRRETMERIRPCPPRMMRAVPRSAHPECHTPRNISL